MAANPYQDFVQKRLGGYETCRVDGVVFHVNPWTYQQSNEPIHVDIPTRAGQVRMSFGARPTTYTLEGFTGTAGLAGLTAMEQFRPMAGNTERIVEFEYPNRFRGKRFVFVNKFDDSISSDMHLYNQYHIELVEYGPSAPTSVNKLANSALQALNIPILPGGGGQVVTTPSSTPGGGGPAKRQG